MAKVLFLGCVAMVGLINVLPALGLFSTQRLASAYGVEVDSVELALLLKHRALLFGIVGGFVFYSLFQPGLLLPALTLTGVSMVGFLLLCLSTGTYNDEIRNILRADIVGIVFLVAALLLYTVFRAGE